MTWQKNGSSRRRLELPPDWYTRVRPAVIKRDRGLCVLCRQPGTDVDHIGDKHDHRLANLRLLCSPHHKIHTQQQAQQGAYAMRAKLQRPTMTHPGRG